MDQQCNACYAQPRHQSQQQLIMRIVQGLSEQTVQGFTCHQGAASPVRHHRCCSSLPYKPSCSTDVPTFNAAMNPSSWCSPAARSSDRHQPVLRCRDQLAAAGVEQHLQRDAAGGPIRQRQQHCTMRKVSWLCLEQQLCATDACFAAIHSRDCAAGFGVPAAVGIMLSAAAAAATSLLLPCQQCATDSIRRYPELHKT